MVGAGGHPADRVVACTFSSMADHTLCCGNALGDVLRSVHKKTKKKHIQVLYIHSKIHISNKLVFEERLASSISRLTGNSFLMSLLQNNDFQLIGAQTEVYGTALWSMIFFLKRVHDY